MITMSTNIVITHTGEYHADDLFATSLIMSQLDGLALIRTRNDFFLETGKENGCFLVDVGGEYSIKKRLFDHHFNPRPCRVDGSLFAAAGMVADYFELGGWQDELARKIDSIDNGIEVPGFDFSYELAKTNPVKEKTEKVFLRRFQTIVHLMKLNLSYCNSEEEFIHDTLDEDYIQEWIQEHENDLENSKARIRKSFIKSQGGVIILDRQEPALRDILHEAPEGVLYVVYPYVDGVMVRQIPTTPGGFAGRKPLPEAWAGLKGLDLDLVTQIPGCIFTHPGRAIAGHKTFAGALQMAYLAISL